MAIDDIESIDTEDDWKEINAADPLMHSLCALEYSMRCRICCEFLKNPVTLPCTHNFCSECIRGNLRAQMSNMVKKRDPGCPHCRATVDVGGKGDFGCLQPQHGLAVIVDIFCKQIRKPLIHRLADKKDQETFDIGEQATLKPTARRTRSTASRRANTREILTSESDENYDEDEVPSDDEAVVVGQEKVGTARPQKLRRVAYGALKKKSLQQLCREVGLPIHGTEEELKARHIVYTDLFNANCDGAYPEPAHRIVQKVIEQERNRQTAIGTAFMTGESTMKSNMERLTSNIKAGKTARSGDAKFDQSLHSNFQRMIQDIKARKSEEHHEREKISKENYATEERKTSSVESEAPERAGQEDSGQEDSKVLSVETRSHEGFMEAASSPCTTEDTPRKIAPRRYPSLLPAVESATVAVESSRKRAYTSQQYEHDHCQERESARPRRQAATITGPWSCPVCTFINTQFTGSLAKCEMCDTPRPQVTSIGY